MSGWPRCWRRPLSAEIGQASFRHFPDGEIYWRYDTPVKDRAVALLCTLDRPDDKALAMLFAAAAARELKAKRVGLIAPYLAYMRQDHRFQAGRGDNLRHFRPLVSGEVDWLVDGRSASAPALFARRNLQRADARAARRAADRAMDRRQCRKPAADRARPRKRAVGGGSGARRRRAAYRAAQDPARRPRRRGGGARSRAVARAHAGAGRRHHLDRPDHGRHAETAEG